jgi:2'-5' RNA ligase
MENIRCFIAIDFCQDILQQVLWVQNQLIKDGFQEIRWMKADNLHITLKFLGDTAFEKISVLKDKIDHVCATTLSFELSYEKMGVFPGWANPRILWLGFERPAQLRTLAEKIETACIKLGFEQEKRPFSPHLTIGRFNQNFPFHKTALLREKCSQLQMHIPKEKVTSVCLYRSILKPTGSEYLKIHTAQLND